MTGLRVESLLYRWLGSCGHRKKTVGFRDGSAGERRAARSQRNDVSFDLTIDRGHQRLDVSARSLLLVDSPRSLLHLNLQPGTLLFRFLDDRPDVRSLAESCDDGW